MKSVQIVIGRGRKGEPHLNAVEWGEFQAEVIAVLGHQLGTFFRIIYGVGYSDGVEENATILGQIHEEDLEDLRGQLQYLTRVNGQNAILLIVGELEKIVR